MRKGKGLNIDSIVAERLRKILENSKKFQQLESEEKRLPKVVRRL